MSKSAASNEITKVKKCLVCDTTNANGERIVRGLCERHHAALMRKLNLLDDENRALCEQELITAGKLLPAEKGGRPSGDTVADPFADIVNKFLPESDEKILGEAAKAEAKKKSKKPKG